MELLLTYNFSFVWREGDGLGGNLLRQFVNLKKVIFANAIEDKPSARVIAAVELTPQFLVGRVPRSAFSLLDFKEICTLPALTQQLVALLEVSRHPGIISGNRCAAFLFAEPLCFPE